MDNFVYRGTLVPVTDLPGRHYVLLAPVAHLCRQPDFHLKATIGITGMGFRGCRGNAEFAGVDNAGVVKSAIWVVIIGYFNNRYMDFNGLFVAALMGNLNT